MKSRSFLVVAVLAIAVLGFSGFVGAQTADNSSLIAQLMAQIQALQAQLQALQGQQGATQALWCHNFNVNLGVGSGGMGGGARASNTADNDVVALKKVLAERGLYDLNIDEPGTAGSSIKATVFHEQLAAAIVEFQEEFADEILKPSNLKRGTGYFGPSTRAKLNKLYGCSKIQPLVCTADCPGVCGNDGKTYCNKCVATSAGITILYDGKCNCTPNWKIGEWQACQVNTGKQIRDVNDLNHCGVTTNIPTRWQTCSTTQPSITITSPNSGTETWQVGSMQNISWTTVGISASDVSTVRLRSESGQEYYIPGNYLATTSGAISHAGSYQFTVPSSVPAGKYKAEVKIEVNGQTYSDASNNFFTITAPTRTVNFLSPAGGTYGVGSVLTITLSEPDFSQSGQSLQLIRRESGKTDSFVMFIGGNHAWTSSYSWTIPSDFSAGTYLIYVSGGGIVNTPNTDVQAWSLPFTIVSSGPQTTCSSFTYSDWGACSGNTQSRNIQTSLPNGCIGGTPVLTQNCTTLATCSPITVNGVVYSLSPCTISMTMPHGQGNKNFSTTIVGNGQYSFSVYGYGDGFPTYGILGGLSGSATGNKTLNLYFNDSYLPLLNGNQIKTYSGYLPIIISQGGATGTLNLGVNLVVTP